MMLFHFSNRVFRPLLPRFSKQTRYFLLMMVLLSIGRIGSFADALPEPFVPEAGKAIDQWSVIGPFSNLDDDDLSTSPAESGILDLERSASAISADVLFWHGDNPFCWFSAETSPSSWLEVQHCFGVMREGNQVYLHRTISVLRDTQMVLALGSHGPLMAWLDGQPLSELEQGIWSPPGDDRWLAVVTLKKGAHQLLIRSTKPESDLVWAVRARFLNAESFARGTVIYPRWQTSAAPPWKGSEPTLWARWGDPEIQKFLEIGPTTASVEVARYADPAGAATYKMGIGQTIGLFPFARRQGTTLFSMRAEIPNLRQGMLGDSLSLVKSSSFLSVIFGSPAEIPSDTEAVNSGKISSKNTEDAKAISEALDNPALTQDDPQGIRLGILRRTKEYLATDTAPTSGSPCPSGWLYLSCASNKKTDDRINYAVQIPADQKIGDAAQLILSLVPLESDPFHIALREPSLASVAEGRHWVLAVLNISRPLRGMKTDEETLDAVRKDLERRYKLSFSRISLVGFQDAASLGLVQALLHPSLYTGAAFLDARWSNMGSWDNLFFNHCPRPALYFAGSDLSAFFPVDNLGPGLVPEDGTWLRRTMTADNRYQIGHDMLTFFEENAASAQPDRVTVSAISRLQGQPRWLVVRQALDLAHPANLTGNAKSTNTLTIIPNNVSQFDMLLKDLPNLVGGKPLVLEIEKQSLRVISREMPEALRLSLVEESDRPPHWEASQIKAEAVEQRTQDEQSVAQADFDVAPLPNGESSSIARLYAAATRRITGAQVAVIPAEIVESGQSKGKITRSDVEGWSRDGVLSTTTLSVDLLVGALARDFAGPRRYVSDGLGAIVHSPSMESMAGTDGPTTGQISSAPSPSKPAITDPRKIFRSTSLNSASPTVMVAGWKPALELLAKDPKSSKNSGMPALFDVKASQIEAAIRLLTDEKKVPALDADIRSMEHKPAQEMKRALINDEPAADQR